MLFGGLLLALFGIGFAMTFELIDRIEEEREARLGATSALVAEVCRRDNHQDAIVARLVKTVIAASDNPTIVKAFAEHLPDLEDGRRDCERLARLYTSGLR